MFSHRREAGERLAERLGSLKGEDCVVLALPRGGVVVGYEVARALDCPLDVLVARKLGAPGDPELAIGAVVEGDEPQSVLNQGLMLALGVGPEYLRSEVAQQLREVERRQTAYRAGRRPAEVQGRTVILVDDGIATGASMRAAIRGLRRSAPKMIVVAVPVAPPETASALRAEAEGFVCLEEPEPFISVGSHYLDFEQTTDGEVVRLLESAGRK